MSLVTRFRNESALALFKRFPELVLDISYVIGNGDLAKYIPGEDFEPTNITFDNVIAMRKNFKQKEDGFGIIEPGDVKFVIIATSLPQDPIPTGKFIVGTEQWRVVKAIPVPKDLPSIFECHCRLYKGS